MGFRVLQVSEVSERFRSFGGLGGFGVQGSGLRVEVLGLRWPKTLPEDAGAPQSSTRSSSWGILGTRTSDPPKSDVLLEAIDPLKFPTRGPEP